jgi:hypothetical protein
LLLTPFKCLIFYLYDLFIASLLSLFTVSLAAMAAGTALAWTSPVGVQLMHENSTLPVTEDQSEYRHDATVTAVI